MLSELGTSCHGKTAMGKGYTKMLVTAAREEPRRWDFLPWQCFLEALPKQPWKEDAALQHQSQTVGLQQEHVLFWVTHERL